MIDHWLRALAQYTHSIGPREFRHLIFPSPVGPGSGEKFEPISTNPYLSIINRLFNEINRLFLEFLLEIENFIENRSDISLKFFISTDYFQISTGYLITKPRFSPGIVLVSARL
jgi:hypothetical protein